MAKLTKEQLEWVYKQDWFPKYCVNLIKFGNQEEWDRIVNYDPIELVTDAFPWNSSPEGLSYWAAVHEEWKNYLKESTGLDN